MIGIITAPILARALGPEGRGSLAAVLQPLTVADAFAAVGIPSAITYFVARGYSYKRMRTVIALALMISCGAVAIALVFYSNTIAEVSGLRRLDILVLWSAVIFGAVIATRRSLWQAHQSYLRLDTERVLGAVLRGLLILGLFLCAATTPVQYAGAYLVSGILAAVILFWRSKDIQSPNPTTLATAPPKQFLKYAGLASFGTISLTLNNRLDQAILPAAVSPSELGYYSVAVTVAELPVIVTTVMARNLFAEVSGGKSREVLLRTAGLGLGAVFVASGILALAVQWLVPFAFGSEFKDAIPLAQVLLAGTCVGSATSCISVVLTGKGRPGLGSVGPAVGAATTAVLMVCFWSSMSVLLAAYIAVIAQVIAGAIAFFLLRAANNTGLRTRH